MSSSSRYAAVGVMCLALGAASLPGPAAAKPPAPNTTAAHRRIVEDAFARWSAGGSGFFDQVLADDVVWTIEGSGPSAGAYRSRRDFIERAVRPFAARLARPVRPTNVRVWADGDHVIAQWKGEGLARDGRPYRNSYAWILRMQGGKAVEVSAFLDLVPYDDVLRRVPLPAQTTPSPTRTQSSAENEEERQMTNGMYVGLWMTEDGHVRQELLPNGRYDEARGERRHAYQGRYEIRGSHIDYWDDTGFTADGEFVDANTLHHGGMVFRRAAGDGVARPVRPSQR